MPTVAAAGAAVDRSDRTLIRSDSLSGGQLLAAVPQGTPAELGTGVTGVGDGVGGCQDAWRVCPAYLWTSCGRRRVSILAHTTEGVDKPVERPQRCPQPPLRPLPPVGENLNLNLNLLLMENCEQFPTVAIYSKKDIFFE